MQTAGSRTTALVVFTVLAHVLAPEDFGLFAYAQAFVLVVQAITESAVSAIVVQRENLPTHDLDSLFWGNLVFSAILTVVGLTAGPRLAAVLSEPALGPLLQVLSLGFFLAALSSMQIGLLRRELRFKALTVRSVTSEGVGGAVAIAAALWGAGVWSLVIQRLTAAVVGVLVLWSSSSWRPRLRFSASALRKHLDFGLNVTGSRILWVLTTRIDDFLVGYFLGTVALGYYTIAYRLTRVAVQLFSGTILPVSLAAFSRLQSDAERMRGAVLNALRMVSLVGVPAFLGLLVLAEPLIVLLFGTRWLPSVPVMRVLALFGLAQSLQSTGAAVLMAAGRADWWMRFVFIRTAIMMAAFLAVVDRGIVMVAWALTVSWYLTSPALTALLRRVTGIASFQVIRAYSPAAIGGAVMTTALVLLAWVMGPNITAAVSVAAGTLLGAAVYTVTVHAVNPNLMSSALDYVKTAMSRTAN